MAVNDYLGIPLEFAQGILSLRNSLAQKDAEIREMRDARAQQTMLEQQRIDLQARGQDLAAMQGAANARNTEQENEIRTLEATARLKMWEEDFKMKREATQQEVLTNIAKGVPTAVPRWMKLPEAALQGPMVKNEAGEDEPSYTGTIVTSADGEDRFYVPLTNLEETSKIQKAQRELVSLALKDIQTVAETKRALAQEANYRRLASQGRTIPPSLLLSAKDTLKDLRDFILLDLTTAKEKNDTSRVEQIKADPTVALASQRDKNLYDRASALLEGALQNKTIPADAPPADFFSWPQSPMARFQRLQALGDLPGAPIPPSERAAASSERAFMKQGIRRSGSVEGTVNLQSGTFTPGERRRLGPGEGRGRKIFYENSAGQTVGTEIYSLEGSYIGSEGTTPHSVSAPAPTTPPAATGPTVPTGPSGPPPGGITPKDQAFLDEMDKKVAEDPDYFKLDTNGKYKSPQVAQEHAELERILSGK